jgi:hypothetical protein
MEEITMPHTITSLWPVDFGEIPELTPVAILRQQGAALGQQTQNIVVGRVYTHATADGFRQQFVLYCSPLAYQIDLLFVDHGIDLYPASIQVVGEKEPVVAANPDIFSDKLREVFSSPTTRKIIASLLAQSKQ